MKIAVVARTRDEQKNIANFCQCYSWADQILIADGGSEDNTKQIASEFKNVSIKDFSERVSKDLFETWRNPHGRHMNFMFNWAAKEEADWIIFDDIDCYPTLDAQIAMRDILETTDKNCVFINRIYMYGDSQWFRDITLPKAPGRKPTWENSTSLYAWKPGVVKADETDPWEHKVDLIGADILHLSPPVSVIHDFYPSDGSRMAKVDFYRAVGEQPECNDPMSIYKDIQGTEPWMKWR